LHGTIPSWSGDALERPRPVSEVQKSMSSDALTGGGSQSGGRRVLPPEQAKGAGAWFPKGQYRGRCRGRSIDVRKSLWRLQMKASRQFFATVAVAAFGVAIGASTVAAQSHGGWRIAQTKDISVEKDRMKDTTIDKDRMKDAGVDKDRMKDTGIEKDRMKSTTGVEPDRMKDTGIEKDRMKK
jgi:hypothetical protein